MLLLLLLLLSFSFLLLFLLLLLLLLVLMFFHYFFFWMDQQINDPTDRQLAQCKIIKISQAGVEVKTFQRQHVKSVCVCQKIYCALCHARTCVPHSSSLAPHDSSAISSIDPKEWGHFSSGDHSGHCDPLEGSEAQLEGSEGQPKGDGQTNGRADGKSPHSKGLRPLPGPLPKKQRRWRRGG